MRALEHPYLHAIFCDDVRQEASGKMLHIGVYGGMLFTPSFPLVLPKMVVVGYFAYPLAEDPAVDPWAPQRAVLTLDDEVLLEVPDMQYPATPATEGMRGRMANLLLGMSPFQLTRPGKLRLRVQTESGEMVSNGLDCREGSVDNPQKPN